jgi:uncharacterized cupredoxin-like copper-binding protein
MRTLMIGLAVMMAACAQQTQQTQPQQPPQQEEPAGPQELTVKAMEYAFQGVPAILEVGQATFLLENAGTKPHEFGLVRITGDQTAEKLVELEEKARMFVEDVGHAFAKPGRSDELTATLEPGRYGYACFVTTKQGDPHAALGMYGEFEVA